MNNYLSRLAAVCEVWYHRAAYGAAALWQPSFEANIEITEGWKHRGDGGAC